MHGICTADIVHVRSGIHVRGTMLDTSSQVLGLGIAFLEIR